MSTTPALEKRPAHRPKGSTRTERTAVIPVQRVTPEQRETWEQLGGADWLRPLLDRERKRLLREAR